MDVERSRTMPIVLFAASVARGSKYDQTLIAYQLVIQLSYCEASNNVDLFLVYGQAVRSARVGNGGFFFCGRGGEN